MRFKRLAVLPLLLAACKAVIAQQAGAVLPRAEVTGNALDARKQGTSMSQIVGREELDKYGDANVMDVLKRQPGIAVTPNPTGRGSQIRMRGLGEGYVRILLDGQPAPAGFSLDTLPPDLVERIEITPVPSVELGAQAIAGTINVIMRRAGQKPERRLNLSAGAGSSNRIAQASGTYSGSSGPLSWLVTGSASEFHGSNSTESRSTIVTDPAVIEDRVSTQSQHSTTRSWNIAPTVKYSLQDGGTIEWQGFVNGADFGSHGDDVTAYLAGATSPWGSDHFDSPGWRVAARSSVQLRRPLTEHLQLTLKAGGNVSSLGADNRLTYVDAADTPTDSRDIYLRRRSTETNAQAILRADLGNTHFFSMGAEATRSRTIDNRADVLDGVSQLDALGTRFDQTVSRPAVFAHDEWDLSKDWSADLGVRWERMGATSTSNAGVHSAFNSTIVTPIAQTVWRIPGESQDKLRLALSKSWRPPNLSAATTVSLDNSVTRPDVAGNPFLKPEIATSFDASYEHGLAESGSLTLAAYAKKVDNAIVTTRSFESGRWVAMPINAGHANAYGIETDAKFKLSTVMAALPGAQVHVSVARNWSTVSSIPGPNNRLGSQLPLTANAGFDHIFSGMPAGWGMNASYVFHGTVRLSEFQQSWQAEQIDVDAYVRWNTSRSTVLRLSASNLLARRFKFRGDYSMQGLDAHYSTTIPTHTSFRASIELRL